MASAGYSMSLHSDENAYGYWQNFRIYQGNKFIKLIDRYGDGYPRA